MPTLHAIGRELVDRLATRNYAGTGCIRIMLEGPSVLERGKLATRLVRGSG